MTAMSRILDVIIATTVILGFVLVTSGFKSVGIIAISIGVLAGGKRAWCAWKKMEADCAAGACETQNIKADVPTLLADSGDSSASDADAD